MYQKTIVDIYKNCRIKPKRNEEDQKNEDPKRNELKPRE